MITVVVGKEIEKLKGEFESVINGMNMVGEIPYNVYSKLFDVGAECIQKAYELGKAELEKENAELQQKYLEESYEKAKLVKELKEAEDIPTIAYLQGASRQNEKLAKAKEIIGNLINIHRDNFCYIKLSDRIKMVEDAEAFIKEGK